MKRMTKEELIALKPSTENPVVIEHIGKGEKHQHPRTVIAATATEYAFLVGSAISTRNYNCIEEYKSHKQPRYETLYECWNPQGNASLYNSKGKFPSFSSKKFLGCENHEVIKRKTGRTVKLNLDTWEIDQ